MRLGSNAAFSYTDFGRSCMLHFLVSTPTSFYRMNLHTSFTIHARSRSSRLSILFPLLILLQLDALRSRATSLPAAENVCRYRGTTTIFVDNPGGRIPAFSTRSYVNL
jgi:hypothetical protein